MKEGEAKEEKKKGGGASFSSSPSRSPVYQLSHRGNGDDREKKGGLRGIGGGGEGKKGGRTLINALSTISGKSNYEGGDYHPISHNSAPPYRLSSEHNLGGGKGRREEERKKKKKKEGILISSTISLASPTISSTIGSPGYGVQLCAEPISSRSSGRS